MMIFLITRVVFIGIVAVCPLSSICAAELHGDEKKQHPMESMPVLEDEEIKIREDQNLPKGVRIEKLHEIWQRQHNLLNQKETNAGRTDTQKVTETTPLHQATSNLKKNIKGSAIFRETAAPSPHLLDNTIANARAVVSIFHQKMYVFMEGNHFREYTISSSKFGVGDDYGSYKTPVGLFRVYCKIGDGLLPGTVLKSRQPTKEIVAPNAKDRDPIVTRIVWLEGLDSSNKHALERCIYIHGTPQESQLGRPASYGCIRMASKDVIKVYDILNQNSKVAIVDKLDKTALRKMHFIEDKNSLKHPHDKV